MRNILPIIVYCILLLCCFWGLDIKYEDKISPLSYYMLSFLAMLLGRLSTKLEKYLANTYLFFGVLLLFVALISTPIHEMLSSFTLW
ncbi:hypothetical protein [Marinifilum breve]|uniref:hypothetical protein n=1 Tax=Marinifilum breve TaxID=2184082 RepID=UPI00105761E9|nr:hypothetical protein [Marinifilum breve]